MKTVIIQIRKNCYMHERNKLRKYKILDKRLQLCGELWEHADISSNSNYKPEQPKNDLTVLRHVKLSLNISSSSFIIRVNFLHR